MINVSLVPAQYVDTCWSKLEGFIKNAAEYTYGRFAAEDLYKLVKADEHQLWVAFEGEDFKSAVITNIVSYPQCRSLCIGFCGGQELETWVTPMLDTLKRYAKDMGCDSIEVFGRPGWSKILKNFGYRNTWVTFELSTKE